MTAIHLSSSRSAEARAAREAGRRDDFMRIAARVFREKGLASGTMEDVASAAGVTKVVLYRRFSSKEQLIQAIFTETIRRLKEGDDGPWYGYGFGVRRVLASARSFEDGYILLIRDGCQQPVYQVSYDALRERAARQLRALLWFPKRPPRRSDLPPLLAPMLEPMISFCNEALAQWIQHGDPAQDEAFIHSTGAMIQAWRLQASAFLGLPQPEVDWPFDTENSVPLT